MVTTAMREYELYRAAVGIWFAAGVVVFVVLFLKNAPYGRFTRTGWGPMVSSKLGWIVMESPAVLVFGLLFLMGDRKGPVPVVLFGIWNVHYVYRAFVFPCRMRSSRENGRGGVFATSHMDVSGGGYFIPIASAPAGGELNIDVAAAYFPFAEGWLTGHARNSTNGGAITSLNATPGIALGSQFIDHGNGQFELYLPGVDSRADGILLVTGAKDEDNYALSAPSADGTHYRIVNHDNGVNATGYEQDPVAFTYLPFGTPDVTMGRITGSGAAVLSQGEFGIRRTATGTYRLSIPGESPTSGVLMVSPEGLVSGNVDNIVTYQAVGNEWEIQTRDLPQNPPTLQNVGDTEPSFNFAFLPLASPPAGPVARPAYDPDRVAAANVHVTEFNGASNSDLSAQVSEGSAGIGVWENNRGDVLMALNGRRMASTDGVLLATVREHIRDNSATGGQTGYGMTTAWNGYYVSTARAESSGNVEMNIDYAVALFPDAAGFSTAQAMPTSGDTDLVIAGAGDTRRSGVLLANVHENQDDFVTAQPKTDGSGWTVTTRDNNGGGASNMRVNYAFLPYGTENLVAGQATQYGNLLNKSGQFSLSREGTGLYRLSIPGESPQTGMLLLTATQVSPSADNTVVYRADGGDFLIQGLDMGSSSSASMPQNTDFNFAFIGFNNPPANPQLRTINPNALSAANIHVVQNDTGNTETSVSVATPQTTPGFTVRKANKGSYWLALDGQPVDADQGVLLSSIRENGRDNGDGAGLWYAQSSTGRDGSTYFVETHRVSAGLYASTEHNIDTAAVYFPFSGGWQAGHALNSANGGPITSLVTTPGINLGTEFIDNGNGQFELRLPGVNALSDGVVLANHGKNEGNYAQAGPAADGSHFAIKIHDDGVNGGSFEQDPVAFAYIPYDTPGVAAGRVSHEGGLFNKSGDFTIRRDGVGTFRLSVTGHTPTTGALLVTGDAFSYSNDNVVSYQPDGNDFIIQTRDLNANPPPTQDAFGEAAFQFAFIPFDNPPTAPGGRTFNPAAQISAANVRVLHNGAGDGAENLHAEVTEGSGYLTTPTWNRGDIAVYQNGLPLDPSAGVMLGTIREHVRDNSAGGGPNDYGVADVYASGGGYWVSTYTASPTVNAEHNIDFAVAYFPNAVGFSTAANVPIPGGSTTLTIPGSGDTRSSGLLMAAAYGNDDNFATVQPRSDGSGWTVNVYDNGSGPEGDSFNYAFLPYGTENLIAGQVNSAGYVLNKTGNFTLVREGTGLYRLNVPGESPATGMLLMNATHVSPSADNTLSYRADGDDFLIQAIDMQNNNTHAPQHTDFNFAFIGFNNPPANPQLREIDSRAILAAKIEVYDNDTPRAAVIQSTAGYGFTIPLGNSGDYDMALEGRAMMQEDGVVIATPRQYSRGGSRGVVSVPGSLTQGVGNTANGGMWIAVHNAQGGAPEHNVDVAAAWFDFQGGWTGGHVSETGTLLAGNRVNQSMLTKLGPGHHELRIGANSLDNGILLAVPAGNGDDNVIAAAPLSDGSGWDIVVRDNDGDFGNSEGDGAYDDFSFVYVPYDSVGLIAAGRIDDDGSILNGAGSAPFSVEHSAAGEYTLEIEQWTPDEGILLLTESKMGYTTAVGNRAEDNWLTYEPDDEGRFSIQSYDLPNETLQDSEFVFLFLPTTGFDMITRVPEPGSIALLGLGGLLLVLVHRRRRRPA